MKAARVSSLLSLLLGIGLVTSPTIIASAQEANAQGANASGLLSQLSAAFSGGKAVQQVQLSGNATWYAGGSEDSGTVSLTASIDGSSQMQLALASTGQRTETQTGAGLNATCQWAGSDGVAHEVHSGSCWRPALWFLPALSLQPSLLPGNLGVIDLGVEPVGTSATPYRHLQSQLTLSGAPDALMPDIVKMSMIDIGLARTIREGMPARRLGRHEIAEALLAA